MTIQEALQLGCRYHAAGNLPEAEGVYRGVLRADPANADALHLLGVLLNQNGDGRAAIDLMEKAVAIRPGIAAYHSNLALALIQMERFEEAIAAADAALRLQPQFAAAHNNRGIALSRSERVEEAVAAYRTAVRFNPEYAEAYSNLGDALKRLGRLPESIDAYTAALRLNPELLETRVNAAASLALLGRTEEAIAAYEEIVRVHPRHAIAWSHLGIALKGSGRLDDAVRAHRTAVALQPGSAEFHNNLANALKDGGQLPEALEAYRRAQALDARSAVVHSNLVAMFNLLPEQDPARVAAEHRLWDERHAKAVGLIQSTRAVDRDRHQRLRIGYMSPNFASHSVARFILPVLESHDHERFEIICYSDVAVDDSVTQSIRASVDGWRRIVGLSDDAAAQQVRADEIDVLVDLAGHSPGNRLLCFARRPAPVQATYLGYPNTTGLSTMDYRITDALADPPGLTDCFHSERLIRLPHGFLCFKPPFEAPAIAEAPVAHTGSITFGCFNMFPKINEPLVALWAQVLQRVPGSRLLLKSKGLSDGSVRDRLQGWFHHHSISPERLELRGWEASTVHHLRTYDEVDIALDTYPYHGTTTTCEALWMGVPVVTLAGRVHVSRVGVSLLHTIGLPELVAQTREEYVALATGLASDIAKLRSIRAGLRERMAASPLLEAASFTRQLEIAFAALSET